MENNSGKASGRRITFNLFDIVIIVIVIALVAGFAFFQSRGKSSGNSVGTETVQGFPYDNALIEMKMKEGSSTLNSVQVFFLAEEYNYTFTVSSHGGEMDTMKEIVTKIVKSFTTG